MSLWAVVSSTGICGASKAGVSLSTGTPGGTVAAGLGSRAFACTDRAKNPNTPAANNTKEAPATSHIRSAEFELALLVSRRFSICLFYQFDTKIQLCCQKKHEEKLPEMAMIAALFQISSCISIT